MGTNRDIQNGRGVSLAAHTAAREAEENGAARFAARATGQTMAIAHVPIHSIAAAWYAANAIWAADPQNAGDNVAKERNWQYRHLVDLGNATNGSK